MARASTLQKNNAILRLWRKITRKMSRTPKRYEPATGSFPYCGVARVIIILSLLSSSKAFQTAILHSLEKRLRLVYGSCVDNVVIPFVVVLPTPEKVPEK